MLNNSNKGRLIIFSAPSGAGKSSLIKEIIDLSPNKIELSISATTRDARDGELNGKDYFFISDKEINLFDSMNEELIDEIVGQSVDIYKINTQHTNKQLEQHRVKMAFPTGHPAQGLGRIPARLVGAV